MIFVALATLAPRAHASNVGFNFGINIGNVPAPVYAPQPVVIDEPPEFVAQPAMGFYAAVGTPYDLFYAANRYYLCRGNMWYAASYYNGPWVQVGYRALPWSLRRYPIAGIRYMRDEGGGYDYNEYRRFRPEWNDWRDRHAGWEGERPNEVEHHRHDRHWGDDDD
jgi:hypothetical protein